MREDHTLESQGHYKKKSMNQHKRSSTKGGKDVGTYFTTSRRARFWAPGVASAATFAWFCIAVTTVTGNSSGTGRRDRELDKGEGEEG